METDVPVEPAASDPVKESEPKKKKPRPERVIEAIRALPLANDRGIIVSILDGVVTNRDSRAFFAQVRAKLGEYVAGGVIVACTDTIRIDEVPLCTIPPIQTPERQPRAANTSIPCTDTGNAERFADLFGHKAKFVAQWNMWIVYDGKRWCKDSAGVMVGALAKETARSIYKEVAKIEDNEARQAMLDWATESEGKRQREAMVFLARSEPGIAINFTALDTDPSLLNVDNGTLDLRTGLLRKHDPKDLHTKISPVRYDATATCPRFEQFLLEIMAQDKGSVEFLRRFLGYCLSGSIREHTMCFWHGELGGNGKSTLTGVMFHLLGEYAIKAAPDLLFKSGDRDRHPTELADLHGARIVVCNETAKSRTWDESTVKDITGGDPIKARRMREDFWSFQPTHKVIVFGNNKPTIADTNDGGLRRRLRMVPFEVTFTGAPDKKLDSTLRKEAPGILAYLVQACLAWQGKIEGQEPGLTEPAMIAEATAGYFAEQDAIGTFIAERCDLNPLAKMPKKDLRVAIETWADEAGEEKPSPKDVAKWLEKHNVRRTTVRDSSSKTVDGWAGIRMKIRSTGPVYERSDADEMPETG
jgi:putative DNA primase/helicase